MLMNGFFQNAYVTRDLDKGMATFKNHHGVNEFTVLDLDMPVSTVHGDGPVKLRVALGWVDALQIELIQPVSGLCQHYVDYLPEDDSVRFHHVCMRVPDWDVTRAEIAKNKWTVTYEGGVEGCYFAYLDARESLGHYIEYLWMSDDLWKATGGR